METEWYLNCVKLDICYTRYLINLLNLFFSAENGSSLVNLPDGRNAGRKICKYFYHII